LADIRLGAHYGLKSDIAPGPKSAMNGSGAFLFNDLIGAGEKGRRDFETKRFRRLEINVEQEFGGLQDVERFPGETARNQRGDTSQVSARMGEA
jgi:hypothetical protein